MTGILNIGSRLEGRYRIRSFIGEGGMQWVYLALDEVLEREVALKLPKNQSAEKRFKRSAIVSAKVNHPNVAKTLDYFEDEQGNPFLVEEYIDGLDLDKALLQKVDSVDPYLVAKIFHHLAKGLAASHHAGVIHRDLKPTNVMVAGGFQLKELKITDFGIAKMADEEIAGAIEAGEDSVSTSKTVVGAMPYMSPEAIQTPRSITPKTDIWSLGAMMYELLIGKKPFGAGLKVVHNIIAEQYADIPEFVNGKPQFRELANQLINIITHCLQKDPSKRPDADELVTMCSNLCYPINTRFEGRVREIHHSSYGFITTDNGDRFFHRSSVYGSFPTIGSRVMFSVFPSSGADRVHPLVVLKENN